MKRFLTVLRRSLAGFADEPTVVICGACALLIISHYQGNTGFFRVVFGDRFDKHPAANVLGHFWWFGCSLLLYLVVPLLLAIATRGRFYRRYGFGLGNWRQGLSITAVFLAVMLPAAAVASRLDAFKGIYPLAGNAAFTLTVDGTAVTSRALFVLYESCYFLYFVGWEFLFRGWMLNGLVPRFGRVAAVLIQMAPFAVMHLGKAELEALGSIVAGVALGVLALRTRSFWYGAFLHGTVAVFMDVISAWKWL
ncbi:MAG: CPBP family intramembrane metalloprotease [Myxococcaceae bacterium]|nr:CPBP family intramembrane metalloprotease [Myxococcaceae bacterium]MCA3015842.1 CPBP family intramembrane metalloprotease [Myxococcaceae bacterium]